MNMQKLGHTVFSPDIFKIIFFIISIWGVCPLFVATITPFLKLFHLYALCVVIFDLVGEKRLLYNRGRFILLLFVISYCFTFFLNTNLINFSDISNFCYLLIALGLVYSYGEDSKKAEWYGGNIIFFMITIANLIGIVMFFMKYYLFLSYQYIGMFPYENRLCGMFGNPNVLGMVSLIGICIGLLLCVHCKKHRFFFIYPLCVIINFISLLLSNSRTQIYSFVLLCAVFAFFWMLRKNRNSIISVLKAFFISCVVLFCIFGGCKLVQYGISGLDFRYDYYLESVCWDNPKNLPNATSVEVVEKDFTEESTVDISDNSEISLQNKEPSIHREEGDDALNGRIGLWKSGVELFKANAMFGIGLDNHDYALSEVGLPGLPVAGNLHNAYFDILVCSGIMGFLCFISFLVIVFQEGFFFFRFNNGDTWLQGAVLVSIICCFLLDATVDSTLIASVYPTAIAFWYFMSQFVHLCEEENMRTGRYKPEILMALIDKIKK